MAHIAHESERVNVCCGDLLEVLPELPDACFDAVVTDPPYNLGFMGKEWDRVGSAARKYKTDDHLAATPYSRARAEYGGTTYGTGPDFNRNFQFWCQEWAAECLRVLKPGGHMLVFGGTRTFHRLACAIEDAGFEIRDSISWLYGSGFPKSMDVSKAIDKAAGAEREVIGRKRLGDGSLSRHTQKLGGNGTFLDPVSRESNLYETAPATNEAQQWQGWGTALKPAWEPIIVARKPLAGTVAKNVLTHGTGALNINACRVEGTKDVPASPRRAKQGVTYGELGNDPGTGSGWDPNTGRWPPNVALSESQAAELDEQTGYMKTGTAGPGSNGFQSEYVGGEGSDSASFPQAPAEKGGGGSRFFPTFKDQPPGRWPPNVVLDESQAAVLDEQSGNRPGFSTQNSHTSGTQKTCYQAGLEKPGMVAEDGVRYGYNDSGGASRFFPTFKYQAKAPKKERPTVEGVSHPTVKPLDLMRWLVRLVTPPDGWVLDPFAGSGTTGEAALAEGMRCVLIEREAEYLPLIAARLGVELVDEPASQPA